jgi:hypothetical protein
VAVIGGFSSVQSAAIRSSQLGPPEDSETADHAYECYYTVVETIGRVPVGWYVRELVAPVGTAESNTTGKAVGVRVTRPI